MIEAHLTNARKHLRDAGFKYTLSFASTTNGHREWLDCDIPVRTKTHAREIMADKQIDYGRYIRPWNF